MVPGTIFGMQWKGIIPPFSQICLDDMNSDTNSKIQQEGEVIRQDWNLLKAVIKEILSISKVGGR